VAGYRARITSREVARAAGVSVNTVSLVVKDSPLVTPATKARVQAVIAELGYRPHAAAAALRSARSHVLGYLVAGVMPTAVDVFRHNLISAFATRARAADHYILLDTFVDARGCAALLQSGRLDGALIDYQIEDAVLQDLVDIAAPVVLVGRDAGDLPVSWVKADEAGGSAMATRHLLDLGHRRVALLSAYRGDGNEIVRQRVLGFQQAIQEAGVALDPALGVQGDWTFESGYNLGRALLLHQPPPTAIFALSEIMALGVLEAAQSLGVRVPDDLAVVTTEDSPWVDHVRPRLSAVHIPMYEVGTRAVEVLLSLLQQPTREPQQIILPTSFVVRESSAPVAGTSGIAGAPSYAPLPARDNALPATLPPEARGGAGIDHG
jgi:DNA-binding LacI/PurR family transcriptional regulator